MKKYLRRQALRLTSKWYLIMFKGYTKMATKHIDDAPRWSDYMTNAINYLDKIMTIEQSLVND